MNNKIDFLSPENLGENYEEFYENIRRGVPSAVFGVHFSLKTLLTSFIDNQVLYLTSTYLEALNVYEQLNHLTDKKITLLTAKDDVLLYKEAFAKDKLYSRITALHETESADVIVCDIESVLQLCPSKINSITLKKGKNYDLSVITKQLVSLGYVKNYSVESKGMFALRGDILDIFPINCENPLRLDFFGDNLEKIKSYDINTNHKIDDLKSADIIAATDIIIEKSEISDLINQLEKEIYNFDNNKAAKRAEIIFNEIKEQLSVNNFTDKLAFIMPLLKNSVSYFSLLKEDCLIVFDESKVLHDKLSNIYKEHTERIKNLAAGGEVFSFSEFQLIKENDFYDEIHTFKQLSLQNFATKDEFFTPAKTFNLNTNQSQKYLLNLKFFVSDVLAWLKNGYTIAVFTENISKAEKLSELFIEEGLDCYIQSNFSKIKNRKINIYPYFLNKGIIIHDAKLSVIASGDLYAKKTPRKKLKSKRNDLFTSPEIGDYAVHEQHGVGRITGTKKIETTDGTKDYISLEYKGGDVLYVPVEQMDILSRYMGEGNPTLAKIGGKEFEKIKAKAAASIKKLAIDLKQLYFEREQAKGYKYKIDDGLMEEFESAFEFEPTEDQIASVEEIKKDMESSRVMDRLLCGDVGYGKTEVAFRAAFKAILSSKQVAFLCPTTILSEQHYNTAIKRFENFGINIEVLNRFKSPLIQKEILKKLENGEIDLIIGTHRLLSKDIIFKDLGLLILDEEQRFGVEHKEKIKTLKTNVDCLTMTATPIPRTLYMSLSGIRDISTLETPPKDRLPVETCVVEETESLIRDACIRELSREGQVFILYNRVKTIYEFAAKIKNLVPEGRISITHGRMSEQQLENNIIDFYNNKNNILITTTIIENGIDLPNANTIIVIDSDRLGISQLYQLRGRVGRSKRLAQAYFTFKANKILSEDSAKRLSAIMEFTELGSGFKIALRDLEIRGAGNVLGGEQHGHIAKIGYELYSKLLKEELLGKEEKELDSDTKITAYIPDYYIESSSARLDCYKKIAAIKNKQDYAILEQDITDTYGEIPSSVYNLFDIALLKTGVKSIKAEKIIINNKEGRIIFPSIKELYTDNIINSVNTFKNIKIVAADKPEIKFENAKNGTDFLHAMLSFIKSCVSFTK